MSLYFSSFVCSSTSEENTFLIVRSTIVSVVWIHCVKGACVCMVECGFTPIHGVSEDMFSHSAEILHTAVHICGVKISCCLTHASNESLFSYVHSVRAA